MKNITKTTITLNTKTDNLTIQIFKAFNLKKDKSFLEKFFNISLHNRKYSIHIPTPHEYDLFKNKPQIEISLKDKDNCFGWTKRRSLNKFLIELKKNNLYLKL